TVSDRRRTIPRAATRRRHRRLECRLGPRAGNARRAGERSTGEHGLPPTWTAALAAQSRRERCARFRLRRRGPPEEWASGLPRADRLAAVRHGTRTAGP